MLVIILRKQYITVFAIIIIIGGKNTLQIPIYLNNKYYKQGEILFHTNCK